MKRKRHADQVLRAPKLETARSRKLRQSWTMTEAELKQLTDAVNKLNSARFK